MGACIYVILLLEYMNPLYRVGSSESLSDNVPKRPGDANNKNHKKNNNKNHNKSSSQAPNLSMRDWSHVMLHPEPFKVRCYTTRNNKPRK